MGYNDRMATPPQTFNSSTGGSTGPQSNSPAPTAPIHPQNILAPARRCQRTETIRGIH